MSSAQSGQPSTPSDPNPPSENRIEIGEEMIAVDRLLNLVPCILQQPSTFRSSIHCSGTSVNPISRNSTNPIQPIPEHYFIDSTCSREAVLSG